MKSVLAILALSLAIASGAALWSEIRALRALGQSDAELFLQASRGTLSLPAALSLSAQQAQLARCDDLMQSVQMQLYPRSVGQAVARGCDRYAGAVLRRAPQMSMAYLVRAVSAQSLGGGEAASEALRQARQMAPREGWMAARRVRFAANAQDARLRAVVEPDIQLLGHNPALRRLLAQIYRRHEGFRADIAQGLEGLSAADQAAFVSLVGRLSFVQGGA